MKKGIRPIQRLLSFLLSDLIEILRESSINIFVNGLMVGVTIGLPASRVLLNESWRKVDVDNRGWKVVFAGVADEFLNNGESTAAR